MAKGPERLITKAQIMVSNLGWAEVSIKTDKPMAVISEVKSMLARSCCKMQKYIIGALRSKSGCKIEEPIADERKRHQ